MTTRVFVAEGDMLSRLVKIGFVEQYDNDLTEAIKPRIGEGGFGERQGFGRDDPFPSDYVLFLSQDQSRALYEALAKYYGGLPEVHALRKDYDHERQRADKMMDALIVIAKEAR